MTDTLVIPSKIYENFPPLAKAMTLQLQAENKLLIEQPRKGIPKEL